MNQGFKRRSAIVALLFASVVGGSSFVLGRAAATTPPPQRNVYDALLRCPGLAEDSAAHVRLVRYDPGAGSDGETLIVYRCLRNGY